MVLHNGLCKVHNFWNNSWIMDIMDKLWTLWSAQTTDGRNSNVELPSWFLPSCAMNFSTFEANNIGLHSLMIGTAAEIPVVRLSSEISVLSLITGLCSNREKKEVMGSFDGISLTVGLLCTADDFCLLFQKAVCISCWQIFSCVLSAWQTNFRKPIQEIKSFHYAFEKFKIIDPAPWLSSKLLKFFT